MAAPKIREGDDARLLAAKSLSALRTANRRIADGAAFYEDIRKGFQ